MHAGTSVLSTFTNSRITLTNIQSQRHLKRGKRNVWTNDLTCGSTIVTHCSRWIDSRFRKSLHNQPVINVTINTRRIHSLAYDDGVFATSCQSGNALSFTVPPTQLYSTWLAW